MILHTDTYDEDGLSRQSAMTDKCVLRSALFRKSECAIKLSRKTLQNLPYFVDMRTRTYFFHFWFRAALFIVIFWSVTQGNWFDCSSLNFWRVSDYCLQKRRPKKRSSWPHTYKERIIWALMLQHPKNMARLHKSKQQPSANYFLYNLYCLDVNYLK